MGDLGSGRPRHSDWPDGAGIYFIAAGDRVKIGCTSKLRARLSVLQSGSAESLKYLGHIELGRHELTRRELMACEAAVHRFFHRALIRGEWFKLDDDVRVVIERLTTVPIIVTGGMSTAFTHDAELVLV